MQIQLNDEEANALVNMLDLAVKASGLAVAETAIVLFRKIKEAKEYEAAQNRVQDEFRERENGEVPVPDDPVRGMRQ